MNDDIPDQAIKALMRETARNISEREYCAGWIMGLEHLLWSACERSGDAEWYLSEVSREEAVILQTLAEGINQWFDPRPSGETKYQCGECFMPLDEWRSFYAETKC